MERWRTALPARIRVTSSSAVLSFVMGLLICAAGAGQSAEWRLPVAGTWRFALDPLGKGQEERWYDRALPDRIELPGALQNQGYGEAITPDTQWTGEVGIDRWRKDPAYEAYRQPGNIKAPFCLQPERHYVGAAWYQRDIVIPDSWQGRRVVLTLERAHWQTRVWLDKSDLGTRDSLSTPHVYDLGTGLTPGVHTLTVRVDNRLVVDVGSWAHSVTDHTQGNWNGIIGRMELTATSPVWIDDIQAYPDLKNKATVVKGRIGNITGRSGSSDLHVRIGPDRLMTARVNWDAGGGSFEARVPLGDRARPWDEFDPAVYSLSCVLEGENAADERTIPFGLRQITTEGTSFLMNGRRAFFRGTLECCIFPQTGYPPCDVESWKRIIGVCKSYGLNHMRFHSWCPPDAAFAAADELGFYFQVECAVWTNPGSGQPIDRWIYEESERIGRTFGNHPSFVLMTHGNEPHGPGHEAFLAEWVDFWKRRDPRRLYTSGSAYPQLPQNEYHVYHGPRGPKGWLGRDYRQDVQQYSVPVIVHEMGQWCVYPNFDEMVKYTGPLKPRNFEIFRESLDRHGMLGQWKDFLSASGKLSLLCYKEEIEAAMRTPGIGGFQLLDLHDFPGQGTALVGILDAFWDSKGIVEPKEFRRFCGPTVPLARLSKRVWTADETLVADVEIAHYGPQPLKGVIPVWTLRQRDGRSAAHGELAPQTIERGAGTLLGRIRVDLNNLPCPESYTLNVGLKDTDIENGWNVWVYPAGEDTPQAAEVLVATTLDDATLDRLDAGGRVLLCSDKASPVHPALTFEPIFWNRYMFNSQKTQTLGLLCDPQHPALAQFPTDSYQDWQWQDVVTRARAIVLDSFPQTLRPIVQVIDDWNTNRRLGLVFECRVGRGKLLICSADLSSDLSRRDSARQLRASLLAYASGNDFNPSVELSRAQLQETLVYSSVSELGRLGARVVSTDSEDTPNDNTGDKAIDADPYTIWHTQWQGGEPPCPHEIVIDLHQDVRLAGFRYLPRQDGSNGWIDRYAFYVSSDGRNWGQPRATGHFNADPAQQTVHFAQACTGRYIRLVSLSAFGGQPWTSVAELDVIPAK